MKFDWAPNALRALNGIFCVYKPADMSCRRVIQTLKLNITRDLNRLPCYKYELHRHRQNDRKNRRVSKTQDGEGTCATDSADTTHVTHASHATDASHVTNASHVTDVSRVTDVMTMAGTDALTVSTDVPANMDDMSGHRLLLGHRYIEDDINVGCIHAMNMLSSGVLVIGIGKKRQLLHNVAQARLLRVYHIKGRLGLATQDFTPNGHIIERTSFFHVKKGHLDKICSSIQTSHLKHMFEYAGVQPDTPEAYDLACQGLIRPISGHTPPVLYDIRCIEFQPPHFTLEVQSINEEGNFFLNLVHDMGQAVKSGAVCEHIHRLRHGHFTTEHALLRRRWTLEDIIWNIRDCHRFTTHNMLHPGPVLSASSDDRKQLTDGA